MPDTLVRLQAACDALDDLMYAKREAKSEPEAKAGGRRKPTAKKAQAVPKQRRLRGGNGDGVPVGLLNTSMLSPVTFSSGTSSTLMGASLAPTPFSANLPLNGNNSDIAANLGSFLPRMP